jgi:proline dehydrogenase
MLRAVLIYLSRVVWARNLITNWGFAWRAASRFVAGETLADAVQVIRGLNARGINATLDHLGEHTTNELEADRATVDILKAIDVIDETHVRANVSIKLTQIGLALSETICEKNLRRILGHARDHHNFVRLDMEDSSWVDQTLNLFMLMCHSGLSDTGVVLQSYLYRSAKDMECILAEGGRIRLCKGAYKEPPEVAYPKKKDVDSNYDHLTAILIEGALGHHAQSVSPDGRFPPISAIASHDPQRIAYAKSYSQKIRLPKFAIEFQMLYGIRRDLQEQTVQEGYPVRVYVPYGTEWYPYFVRRLAERPANLWFFLSNFFRK